MHRRLRPAALPFSRFVNATTCYENSAPYQRLLFFCAVTQQHVNQSPIS